MEAQTGLPGQERNLSLVLKLLADYGLIGLPSVGKSSLLNCLTKAEAKIGDYPFTTLEPNLGEMDGKIIADIPGLIDGASKGKGLGIKFLKHIEKVGLIFHCISADSPDPASDYQTVRRELKYFNEAILDKPEIILLTKTDLVTPEIIKKQMTMLNKENHKIIPVSTENPESLENLKSELRRNQSSEN